jgi:hypothetical protein
MTYTDSKEQAVHIGKVWAPVALKASGNRKLSPWQHQKKGGGHQAEVVVKNSFGTLSSACKWTTPFCEGCYAGAAEVYPNVYALLTHNTDCTRGRSFDELVPMLDRLVHDAEVQMVKRGVPVSDRFYRPHWDGELDSFDELRAWNQVALFHPDMQVFLYTRAHALVRAWLLLTSSVGSPNFVIYLSVDEHNVDTAKQVEAVDPKGLVKYAFCGMTWQETEEIAALFPKQRKGPRCPELTGKVPLIVWESDSERAARRSDAMAAGVKRPPDRVGVGACVECGMCPKGINNVRFAQER